MFAYYVRYNNYLKHYYLLIFILIAGNRNAVFLWPSRDIPFCSQWNRHTSQRKISQKGKLLDAVILFQYGFGAPATGR